MAGWFSKPGLGFDDVLLVPQYSEVSSRKDVDVSTRVSRRIKLNIPIISANMDTVTEHEMAIVLAQMGGLGVIHQFMPIDEQIEEVVKVKTHTRYMIENPLSIHATNLGDAKKAMRMFNVSSVLVMDSDLRLIGILTKRDIQFEENLSIPIRQLMTPFESLICSGPGTTIETAKELIKTHKVEKIPLIDGEQKIVGLITAADIRKMGEYPNAVRDYKGRLLVGAAIGVKSQGKNDDPLTRAKLLANAGVDIIVIDTAHGDSKRMVDTIRKMRPALPGVDIIAGNVSTSYGAKRLIETGIDGIKVGVGNGVSCRTQKVAGAGVPQITTIIDCREVADDIPICSDGGIKESGDIAKALAAGANTVMLGNLLAGTAETPGKVFWRDGERYKRFRGSSSIDANLDRREREYREAEPDSDGYTPEGDPKWVPYKGPVKEVIEQLLGGLRSGITYCGSDNIRDMQENAEFIQVRK